MKKIILFFSLLLLLNACSKEQNTADNLVGKWQISSLKWANGNPVDVTNDKHSIEFMSCDKAYTASCSGVYFLDYADTLKKDLNDTFKFELRENEISISSVKNSAPGNAFVTKILRQRYIFENKSKSNIDLKRFRTFADSSNGILNATKQ
jgi:hypothetical protein